MAWDEPVVSCLRVRSTDCAIFVLLSLSTDCLLSCAGTSDRTSSVVRLLAHNVWIRKPQIIVLISCA